LWLSGFISKAGKTYKAEEAKAVVTLYVLTKADNHNSVYLLKKEDIQWLICQIWQPKRICC